MSLPLHEQAGRPSEDYVYASRVERVRCSSDTAPVLGDGATLARTDASSFVRSDVHDADIQPRDPETTHTVSPRDETIRVVLTYVFEAASAETARAPHMCPDTGP